MKKLMISLGVLAFTACAPTAQLVYEKGNTTREALIYEDRVVVVTKTTVTKGKEKKDTPPGVDPNMLLG